MNMNNGQFTLVSVEEPDEIDNDCAADTDENNVEPLEGEDAVHKLEDGMSHYLDRSRNLEFELVNSLTLILLLWSIFLFNIRPL